MHLISALLLAIGLCATPQHKPGEKVVTIRLAYGRMSDRFVEVIPIGTPLTIRAQSDDGLLVSEFRGVVNPSDVTSFNDAVRCFTELIDSSEHKGPFYRARGKVLLLQGRFAKAEDDLGQALLLSPDTDTFGDHAACLAARSDWGGVVADCDWALRLSPHNVEALRLRALAHLQTENYEKAIDDCTRALELGGSDFGLRSIRAQSQLQKTEYSRAIVDSSGMIALCPDRPSGFVLRSWAHYFAMEYDEALADCTKVTTRAPRDFWVASQLAAIHAAMGRLDDAIEWQTKALAIERENAAAQESTDDECKVGEFQKVPTGSVGRLKEGRSA